MKSVNSSLLGFSMYMYIQLDEGIDDGIRCTQIIFLKILIALHTLYYYDFPKAV